MVLLMHSGLANLHIGLDVSLRSERISLTNFVASMIVNRLETFATKSPSSKTHNPHSFHGNTSTCEQELSRNRCGRGERTAFFIFSVCECVKNWNKAVWQKREYIIYCHIHASTLGNETWLLIKPWWVVYVSGFTEVEVCVAWILLRITVIMFNGRKDPRSHNLPVR